MKTQSAVATLNREAISCCGKTLFPPSSHDPLGMGLALCISGLSCNKKYLFLNYLFSTVWKIPNPVIYWLRKRPVIGAHNIFDRRQILVRFVATREEQELCDILDLVHFAAKLPNCSKTVLKHSPQIVTLRVIIGQERLG